MNYDGVLANATDMVDASYRYGYAFDDIGNRKTSAERETNFTYAANNLNQYTTVGHGLRVAPQEEFVPQYDLDGNQTLVKTATGVWSVSYNGENRPVLWTQGTNTILMSFDRMGRRVTKNDQRFVYNGYLQIAEFSTAIPNSSFLLHNSYIWDPTEPVATRPLAWTTRTTNHQSPTTSFYTHDGNKNVSEVIASDRSLAAHYEYAPFGALTVPRGEAAAANPFRFSSEYAEDDTATVYYNYRHYEPVTGRWLQRDPIEEDGGLALYAVVENCSVSCGDCLGLELLKKGTIQVNPHLVKVADMRIGRYEWYHEEMHYDKYEYEVTGDKSCDVFHHAFIQNVKVSGNYVGAIDSVGFGLGRGLFSVGYDREYVVECHVRPPTTNDETGTCIYLTIDVSVYKIEGLSIGASANVGKNGSVGTSVGPLKSKENLGGAVVSVSHCCCDE